MIASMLKVMNMSTTIFCKEYEEEDHCNYDDEYINDDETVRKSAIRKFYSQLWEMLSNEKQGFKKVRIKKDVDKMFN